MQNLRSIALAVGGIVILAAAAAFTLSLTLIVGAVLTVSLAARMISMRPKPVPVRIKTGKQPMRVWDDGRGTIIDL
ncbi:MAG: hypothetical protein ACOH2J_11640 [Allorhizobium sp.]